MTDVFIAYAREDSERVRPIAELLQAEGWDVWWDPSEPLLNEGDVADSKLNGAGAVLVVWSTYARSSEHVRAEAATGLYKNKLIQTRIDYAPPPRPFDQVEVADLSLWPGDREDMIWQKVIATTRHYCGEPGSSRPKSTRKAFAPPAYVEPKRTLRVVPMLGLMLAAVVGAGAWFVDPFDWRGRRPETANAGDEGPARVAAVTGGEAGVEAVASSPEAEAAWAQTDRNDPTQVRAFLTANPRGSASESARSLLRVMDAQAWVETVTADTDAAYTRYLKNFPADAQLPGAMAAAANERLTELGQERSQAIAQIQRGLGLMDLYRGTVDGVAGDGTARAVRTFASRTRAQAPNLATAAPRDLRAFGDQIAAAAGGAAAQEARTASLATGAAATADRQRLEQAQALVAAAAAESPAAPSAADADGLAQAQLRTADVAAWAVASATNTVAAYQSYIDAYPLGVRANDAREAMAELLRPPPFAVEQLSGPVRAAADAARQAQSTAVQRAGQARSRATEADVAAASARAGADNTAVITAPDGDRYETEVANNAPNGLGVRVSGKAASNGDRYRGQIRNGLGVGLGVYEYAENPNNAAARALRYEGEHAGDTASGFGVVTWRSGDRFSGEDLGGGASRGVLSYANGSRYEGELRNGARHGYGVAWTAEGAVLVAGRWENGALVEPARGQGP